METEVYNIINIFTIVDGNIYLIKNNNNLISVKCDNEFNIVNNNYLNKNLKINNLNLKQYYTFSEKKDNKLILKILFLDIVNYDDIILDNNFIVCSLDTLNMNDEIINKSIEYLKKELLNSNTIKKIYNNEFSLPDIQKVYEHLFDSKLDRRNFRKRLMKLDIIEDLCKISTIKNGRPAKLYKFKDNIENKNML